MDLSTFFLADLGIKEFTRIEVWDFSRRRSFGETRQVQPYPALKLSSVRLSIWYEFIFDPVLPYPALPQTYRCSGIASPCPAFPCLIPPCLAFLIGVRGRCFILAEMLRESPREIEREREKQKADRLNILSISRRRPKRRWRSRIKRTERFLRCL